MGSTTIPSSVASKTRFATTLTSGTSWTVPAGVTYVNVTLRGGGGGGAPGYVTGASNVQSYGIYGCGGQIVSSTLATTPLASITYAIGAGGAGGVGSAAGSTGGTTTFTGATSAVGGNGGMAAVNTTSLAGPNSLSAGNGGQPGNYNAGNLTGGAGGNGSIDVEYWV
jgi:hypothetical protein